MPVILQWVLGSKSCGIITLGFVEECYKKLGVKVGWGEYGSLSREVSLRIQSIAHTHTEVFFFIPPFVHLFTFEKVGLKWLRALSWHIRDHVRHWVKLLKDMVVPCFHSWYVDVSLGITCQLLQGAGEECFGLC